MLARQTYRLPVLMYHGIAPGSVGADGHRRHVSLTAFAEQMDWLAKSGYQTVSPGILRSARHPIGTDPKKLVAITFDDGFRSQLAYAAPILKDYGFSATAFIATQWCYGALDYSSLPVDVLPGDRIMSWDEVGQLLTYSWEIGSHTMQHINCAESGSTTLAVQLHYSKEAIRTELGMTPTLLAYPYGKYSRATLDIVPRHFRLALGKQPGLSTPTATYRYRQHRIEVNKHDSLSNFQQKVLTGYKNKQERLKSIFIDQLHPSAKLKDVLDSSQYIAVKTLL